MKCLVFGGAGFIGSHIVRRFVRAGHSVTVIDGLLPHTGGRRDHLDSVRSEIDFIDRRIEEIRALDTLVRDHDLVIDAIAWTSHRAALDNISYDRELNLSAHSILIDALLKQQVSRRVIYLGSRAQYGGSTKHEITEETPLLPIDVQGIHKVAAEGYFRICAGRGIDTISLRFPNCFGEYQPYEGSDIGLIAMMMREIIDGREVEIYGQSRSRCLVYAPDVAECVLALSAHEFRGFEAFNLRGELMSIEKLAQLLIRLIGRGRYCIKPLPSDIARIDVGSAPMSENKLRRLLGTIPRTFLDSALATTVEYMRGALA